MKLGKLSVLTAAALLAGVSFAAAQSQPAGSGSTGASAPQGQCWDMASNSVKDKAGSASGARTPGSVTTGATPSGQNNNSKDTGNTTTRPANAANLPNC